MEILKKQKKILILFGVFLAFMYACTLISRVIYTSKLPQVSVAKPGRMAISHQVEAEGMAAVSYTHLTLPRTSIV